MNDLNGFVFIVFAGKFHSALKQFAANNLIMEFSMFPLAEKIHRVSSTMLRKPSLQLLPKKQEFPLFICEVFLHFARNSCCVAMLANVVFFFEKENSCPHHLRKTKCLYPHQFQRKITAKFFAWNGTFRCASEKLLSKFISIEAFIFFIISVPLLHFPRHLCSFGSLMKGTQFPGLRGLWDEHKVAKSNNACK